MAVRDIFSRSDPDTILIYVTETWQDPGTSRPQRKTHRFAVDAKRGEIFDEEKIRRVAERIAFGELGKRHALEIKATGVDGKSGRKTTAMSSFVPKIPEGYKRVDRSKARDERLRKIAKQVAKGGKAAYSGTAKAAKAGGDALDWFFAPSRSASSSGSRKRKTSGGCAKKKTAKPKGRSSRSRR